MITSSVLRDKNSMLIVGLDLGDKFPYITIIDQDGCNGNITMKRRSNHV
jgi:hypothetical protein